MGGTLHQNARPQRKGEVRLRLRRHISRRKEKTTQNSRIGIRKQDLPAETGRDISGGAFSLAPKQPNKMEGPDLRQIFQFDRNPYTPADRAGKGRKPGRGGDQSIRV